MASAETPLLHDDSSVFSSTSSLVRRKANNRTRYIAFASANLSCLCAGSITVYSLYGHLFQERMHYTQSQVALVSSAAMAALYLPVPIFGYLCDRVGPAPLSLASAFLFFFGYLLAAFTYKSGASDVTGYTHERGWPIWVMVVAFVIIGAATTCMYISAVTTCVKNFGRGKHKAIALAAPVASFGLSGLWQSQVGQWVLCEWNPDGTRGDVDVFRFFVFLASILLAVGILGTVLLKVVGEEELIDEAVDELERSGLLEDDRFFRRGSVDRNYGSIHSGVDDENDEDILKAREEEARKKTWLLNEETSRFLKDHTMWVLTLGFFFVSGPGEAYLTNLGSIIGTLEAPNIIPSTSAATHVSIVAATSTGARLLYGYIADKLAPHPLSHHYQSAANSISSLPPQASRFSVSLIIFLLSSVILLITGQIVLASGVIQSHSSRFWIVSAFIGSGYGALYSLMPLAVSIIYGTENFGTNWGIVATVPAFSSAMWNVIYSHVYQTAAESSLQEEVVKELFCHGSACYTSTYWFMALSSTIGCGLWVWAWKGKNGWSQRGVIV